ncbi:MAG: CRISPR-associated protein Cas5 [Wolinella succinogenes]|uniref:CRISPR-associated protein Cas5 n=1 Tax=Wolinella succinogenes TaxID=844 RepID=UPI00169559CB|nr:CRISPR-associated protein Cas5 [Wolinella succinogenes]NLU35396.1 CRISPR-associated protein Cas5 [Wolinella succinogenes]
MFAFKIWGDFACFRDPLTISQTVTFPFPPKTTVGGMMASIMGLEWSEWMEDESYFDFKYSVVLLNPIRKKSFVQNYINDYTKHVEGKLKSKLERGLREAKNPQKQISRELILNPKYLIVIDKFKYESEVLEPIKNHESKFPFYLGNSEFLGNFKYIEASFEKQDVSNLHSFTKQTDNIDFMQAERKYTNTKMATKVIAGRLYRDYENFVICNKDIVLKSSFDGIAVKTAEGEFFCELA